MRTIRLTAYLLAFLSLLLLVSSAMAQEMTGGIQGTVKDPSGAVIPGATVQLTSPALMAPLKRETDGVGFYRFMSLSPGTYTAEVSATGFRKYVETNIKLDAGRILTVDAPLEVGPTTQVVEVQASPFIVDTTQSKIAVNVGSEFIDTLPKGRSFTDLISVAPGARWEPLQSTNLSSTTTAGFQIDGASDGENVYALEGMDTSDIYGGGVGMNVPLDFVQELNIRSAGFEAEYGGALGGVVNIVTKRGANTWHGSGFLYVRSDMISAKPRPGLRLDPEQQQVGRVSESYQYYQYKADSWRTLEPGFDLGGYVKKDVLWLYTSYVPTLDRTTRTVNFSSTDPNTGMVWGNQTFKRYDRTHYGLGRLDFSPYSSIRTALNWNYAYSRWHGNLPTADSEGNLLANGDGASQPTNWPADWGQTLPNNAYVASVYFTISSKMLASARWGYWYSDTQDRGRPSGDRYQYLRSSMGLIGLDGTAVPIEFQHPNGFTTLGEVRQTIFDKFSRTGFNFDWSWLVRGAGTHTLKAGYAMNRIHNDVFYGPNRSWVRPYWGYTYTPVTDSGAEVCVDLRAQNLDLYGRALCRGIFGTYRIIDISTVGNVASFNHSIFFQDAWKVGRFTLNLGVRMDKEYLPSFSSGAGIVSTPIKFGFFDKVAPRLGAAVDVLGNGKLKVFGSWGMFYDIMKYSMPRGSFGGDYWHDCWYTLDTYDYTDIAPMLDANNHTCPGGGGLPGTKIEEIDWRIPSNTTESAPPPPIANDVNGRIDKNLKPMRLRRIDVGAEYALRPSLGLEVRYTRNRLDYTIEDAGILGPGGEEYYIVNPGYGITKKMLYQDCEDTWVNPENCPSMPKAVRNYDGLEVRLIKRWSQNWGFSASYTYSRLWGNYSGLTSTEIGDAAGGRHDPNVSRYFDLLQMTYDAHGKPTFGILPTDRPHTLGLYGAHRKKWWGMESTFGLTQLAYSGVPLTTEIPMISSTAVHPEGIGNWLPLTADAEGYITAGAVQKNHRGPAFTNTNFLLTHDLPLSETTKFTFEVNIMNLFNQKHALRYYTNPLRGGQIPVELETFFQGFDYVSALNDPVEELALDSRYGYSDAFNAGRQFRFKIKFSF